MIVGEAKLKPLVSDQIVPIVPIFDLDAVFCQALRGWNFLEMLLL